MGWRRRAPSPGGGRVVLPLDPGLSGPSLDSGLAGLGPADSKPQDTGGGEYGEAACPPPPHKPRPIPEKRTWQSTYYVSRNLT